LAFTDTFIRRPILAIVVSLLILLVGASAVFNLQIRQYPRMESATITVNTRLPGATQEVMQGFVTTPIAQAISTASGIEYLTSVSRQGQSAVSAKLKLNADADRSMTEILSKVQEVKFRLPEGVSDPVIAKITDGATAVQYLGFLSEGIPLHAIIDFIDRVARPQIASIPGVGIVSSIGGAPLAMRIWVDPVKLAARGLTAGDLTEALRDNNVQASPGQLKGDRTQISITAGTDLRDISSFRDMVLKSSDGGLVRLGDVATVELGGQNYDYSALSAGMPSVMLSITPAPDGNPLEIVADVNALLPELQKAAPPGLTINNNFDRARFVDASIEEVAKTLSEAVLIVVLVIFLSLGSLRAVIIPVVTIPLSLLGTAALMLLFGFSFNLLTLLAAVLAIGLVVDDAIVVVENIHRHMAEGRSPREAALLGAREIIGPVIAMTITLAAAYAPIGLVGGLTGALFREFAFTLAAAVIVSGVIALTLSPMMSSRLLRSRQSEGRFEKAVDAGMQTLARRYDAILRRTLAARPAVLIAGIAILGASAVFFLGAKRELAPQEDMGYVFVQAKAPQYANVDYTTDYTRRVEKLFRDVPEYVGSFYIIGAQDGPNVSFGGIVLERWDERERDATAIQRDLSTAVAQVTGVTTTAFQDNPLPAGSGGLPVQMVVRSSADFPALYATLQRLTGAAWNSGLFAFVEGDLAFDSQAAHISVDRAKAGQLGVSMSEIADTLAVFVGENYVNRFNWHDRSYDVIVQVKQDRRLTPDDLGRFQVRTESGGLVPLSTITRVDVGSQPNKLTQFNQLNSATLSAVLMPGVTMGQAVDFLRGQKLPPGTSLDWLSNSRQFVQESNQLTILFGFALVVIFLVLAAQFESFRDPLVILVTVPLAVSGALAPLYLGYTTLNIYTQIGLVTLIGLISKHGILMVSFANQMQLRNDWDRTEAIRHAAVVRMRPILMTTAAMVAGLVPLLFASGAGAGSRFSIGVVVVMGMCVGTLFTLFVLPTVYSMIAADHRPDVPQ
jgi:multidrug efflux pump